MNKYYSVSQLKVYESCSNMYKNKYVLKIRQDRETKALIIGLVIHECLEKYYREGRVKNPIEYLKEVLEKKIEEKLGKSNNTLIVDSLIGYAKSVYQLYERSNEGYKGRDKIRKRDGSVASNPSMTKEWKLSEENINRKHNKQFLDIGFDSSYSMTAIVGEIYYYLSRYTDKEEINEIIEVEYGISSKDKEGKIINKVLMPEEYGKEKDIYFKGYIDLIAKNKKGEILIIDHKTDSAAYKEEDVRMNVQLLSYVWAYEEITGKKVDYIGVNNIKRNQLVLARPVNKEKREEILSTLFSYHKLIDMGFYNKKSADKNSLCKNYYGEECPYLETCWGHI